MKAFSVFDELETASDIRVRHHDAEVPDTHRSGSLTDAELVGLGSNVWTLHDEFTAAMASAYRDALTEQALAPDQQPSALIGALLGERRDGLGGGRPTWPAYRGWFWSSPQRYLLDRQVLPDIESRLHMQLSPDLQVGVVSLRSQRAVLPVLGLLRSADLSRLGVSPVYADLENPEGPAPGADRAGQLAVGQRRGVPVRRRAAGGAGRQLADDVLSNCADGVRFPSGNQPDEREALLNTLATYVAVRGSAVEAGKRLHCHPNTVRHRLRRIERRTGRSHDDPLASAELCVALEAVCRLPESSDADTTILQACKLNRVMSTRTARCARPVGSAVTQSRVESRAQAAPITTI